MTAAVVLVLLVSGTLAIFEATRSIDAARGSATADAAFQAKVAAADLSQSDAAVAQQVVSVASTPGLGAVFAHPAGCQLSFSLALFPSGH
ncbi:MAG TPA: hypothetical protein VGS21_10840, partial [Acidimicrobiales bacterium]|nr:hypothetical protein [Acidimicrobiales bacterium]